MDPETEILLLRSLLADRDAKLSERDQQLAAALRQVEEQRARAEAAEEVVARLQRDLEALRRLIGGNQSERLDPSRLPVPEGKPAESGPPADPAAADKEDERRRARRKSRPQNRRRDISEMDELETVEHRSKVENRTCPCGCGAPAVTIGEDVSWRLERIPARLIRHMIVQEKVAFPEHRARVPDTPGTVVVAPPVVSYALPKAMCGNELLAEVVIDKYTDHLPLHRQAQRFNREGIDLSRSTLCDWMMELADRLNPIVLWMAAQVRSGSWLRADATGMPVMDETRTKGKAHHGHIWAWGNYDAVIFQYTPDKEAPTVSALFTGFQGVVVIDGATDFNLLEKTDGIVRAGCWAHARRKLYEAIGNDAKRALQGLGAIRRLFLVERLVMESPLGQRLALRAELCKPILDGIRTWVDTELQHVVPGSLIYKALKYISNQWHRLTVFLTRPEIPCHNNDTERDLHRPVKGRDNYLFAGSPRGAHAAAIYYTLVGTCLLQGIDPKRYLVEIFGRFAEPVSRLTPQAIREQWEQAATGAMRKNHPTIGPPGTT